MDSVTQVVFGVSIGALAGVLVLIFVIRNSLSPAFFIDWLSLLLLFLSTGSAVAVIVIPILRLIDLKPLGLFGSCGPGSQVTLATLLFSSVFVGAICCWRVSYIVLVEDTALVKHMFRKRSSKLRRFWGIPPKPYTHRVPDGALHQAAIEWMHVLQLTIYSLVMLALWVVDSLHYSNAAVPILALVLFFIIDDWNIIVEYARHRDGRILRSHQIRVWIANLILFVGLILLVLPASLWAAVPAALSLGLLLYWRCSAEFGFGYFDWAIDRKNKNST